MKLHRVTFKCEQCDEGGYFQSENYLYFKTKKEVEEAVKDFEAMAKRGEIGETELCDGQSVDLQGIDTLEVPTDPDELLKFVRKWMSSAGALDLLCEWEVYGYQNCPDIWNNY